MYEELIGIDENGCEIVRGLPRHRVSIAVLEYLWLSPEAKRRVDAEKKVQEDEVRASYYREDGWKFRPSPYFEMSYIYQPYVPAMTHLI